MSEIQAFWAGFLFKAVISFLLGKVFAWLWGIIKDWPRVIHYLAEHEGASADCPLCNQPPSTPSVDTVS